MKSQEYKDLKNQIKVLRKDILEQIEGRSFVSYKLPNVFNMEWVKEEKTKKSISDEIEKAIREFIVKRPYKSPEYLILSQEQYIDLLNEIKTDKELYYYHGLFVCIFKSDIKKSIKVA